MLVRNRCVIEVVGGVFVLSLCFLGIPVGVGAFIIWQSSIFFSLIQCRIALCDALSIFVNDVVKKDTSTRMLLGSKMNLKALLT